MASLKSMDCSYSELSLVEKRFLKLKIGDQNADAGNSGQSGLRLSIKMGRKALASVGTNPSPKVVATDEGMK